MKNDNMKKLKAFALAFATTATAFTSGIVAKEYVKTNRTIDDNNTTLEDISIDNVVLSQSYDTIEEAKLAAEVFKEKFREYGCEDVDIKIEEIPYTNSEAPYLSKTDKKINAYTNLSEEEANKIKQELESENSEEKQVIVTINPFTAAAVGEQHEHALHRTKLEAQTQADAVVEFYQKDGFDVDCEIEKKNYTIYVNQRREYNGEDRQIIESFNNLTEEERNEKISFTNASVEQLVDIMVSLPDEYKNDAVVETIVVDNTNPVKTEEIMEKKKQELMDKYVNLGYNVHFADITITKPVLVSTEEILSDTQTYNDKVEFSSLLEAQVYAKEVSNNSKYTVVNTEIKEENSKYIVYVSIVDYNYDSIEKVEDHYVEYSFMTASKTKDDVKYNVDVVTTDYGFDYFEDLDSRVYYSYDITAQRSAQVRYNIDVEVKVYKANNPNYYVVSVLSEDFRNIPKTGDENDINFLTELMVFSGAGIGLSAYEINKQQKKTL